MRVYKVLKRDGEELYSCMVGGKARVKYEPCVWVSAPDWLAKEGYHLTAFKDFWVAEAYYEAIIAPPEVHHELWEAEAENVIKRLPPKMRVGDVMSGLIVPWYKDGWPIGTVMAKQIKLVRPMRSTKPEEIKRIIDALRAAGEEVKVSRKGGAE